MFSYKYRTDSSDKYRVKTNVRNALGRAFPVALAATSGRALSWRTERIIRWIGTPAQPLKPRQKALGRQLGDIQVKRLIHPIVKKRKNITIDEKMIA